MGCWVGIYKVSVSQSASHHWVINHKVGYHKKYTQDGFVKQNLLEAVNFTADMMRARCYRPRNIEFLPTLVRGVGYRWGF